MSFLEELTSKTQMTPKPEHRTGLPGEGLQGSIWGIRGSFLEKGYWGWGFEGYIGVYLLNKKKEGILGNITESSNISRVYFVPTP